MNTKLSIAPLMCALLLGACAQKNDDGKPVVPINPKGTIQEEASTKIEGNWFIRDPQVDGEEGVSSDLALATMNLPEPQEIIVAVIDSGVDYEHEDLKDVMWVNPGETGLDESGIDKASNGIDDDGNGYVDDVHGWNYLGGADGKNIEKETLEMTREVVHFKKKIAAGEILTPEEEAYFQKVSKAVSTEKNSAMEKTAKYTPVQEKIQEAKNLLKQKLGLSEFTKDSLEAISSGDSDVLSAKEHLLQTIQKFGDVDRIKRALDYYADILNYYTNEDFDPRSTIVKDDPSDFSDINYGNNDVRGPDASHGTHVSGIIAASRGNGLGIDGVSANVKIMALRAVPDGDERDKDVALAIRYAADNGAKIINMSFGKGFSPYKDKVDEAFMYAAEKGVLFMNAAGNDNADLDVTDSFPSKYLGAAPYAGFEIPGYINVGASARLKDLGLPASFSNFGKKSVDLFAPGHRILSAVPGNKYATYSGTSMAAPTAAGVAALVWTHFPELTAVQLKAILKESVRGYGDFEVRKPGADQYDLLVPFTSLSETGGIIDAKTALELTKFLSEN